MTKADIRWLNHMVELYRLADDQVGLKRAKLRLQAAVRARG